MLASMRTTANSLFMKLLLGLLVLSFAVWGVGDVVRSGNNAHLLTVGNEGVTYAAFASAVNTTERMMQSLGMTNIPRATIEEQAMRRLVEEKIVAARMHEAGLAVNQELLALRLRNAQAFHDVRGKFDPALFQAMLAQQRTSEAVFLDTLKADIRANLFSASLDTSAITPPASWVALTRAAQAERREAVVVNIPASSITITPPDAQAISDYYEANKELLYLQPERRTLEYVTFSAANIEALAEKSITAEAIADRIAQDPEHFAKDGEKIARTELRDQAMETVIDDVTVAIEDALAAGESMGKALAAAGLPTRTSTLRDISNNEASQAATPLLQAVSARGFALGEGETSGIETTADGTYYMVRVTAITPATPKPLDAVRDDVQTRATQRARSKALRAKAEEIRTLLTTAPLASETSDKNINIALIKHGVRVSTVDNIVRPGEDKTKNISSAFAEAIYEHDVGGVAGPLMQDDSAQLAKVTAVRFIDMPHINDDAIRLALSKALPQEILAQYFSDLTRRYRVSVNEGMLQQIRAQQDGGA